MLPVKLLVLSLGLFAVASMAAGYDCYIVADGRPPARGQPNPLEAYLPSLRTYVQRNCEKFGYVYNPDHYTCHIGPGPIPRVFSKAYNVALSAPGKQNILRKMSYTCDLV